MVASVITACATAPAHDAATSRLRVVSTTHTCPAVLGGGPVAVAIHGRRLALAPGESVALELPRGAHEVVVRTSVAPEEVVVWHLEGAEEVRWVGCAAPEALASGPDRVPVRLRYELAGCEPGVHGPHDVLAGERLIAVLTPDSEATRWLPRGALGLAARARAPGAAVQPLALVPGDDGALTAVFGCHLGDLARGGLAPVVVRGPAAGCAPGRRRVQLAGLVAEVGPGEALTAFTAPGLHVLQLGAPDGSAPEIRRLDLGAEGLVVELAPCEAGSGDPAPLPAAPPAPLPAAPSPDAKSPALSGP